MLTIKPCKCGKPPRVQSLNSPDISIYCCTRIGRKKSYYLTDEERRIWEPRASDYPTLVEKDILYRAVDEWNERRSEV